MIPDGLITYSTGDLERMAEELILRRPDVPRGPPINVERFLQRANKGNVEIQYLDGLRHLHHLEGCVWSTFMSPVLLVIIDSLFLSRPWDEYNAVFGEEFAHIHLHPAIFTRTDSFEETNALHQDPQWLRYEQDAKRFSAMIRMPGNLLLAETAQSYIRVTSDCGFGSMQDIERRIIHDLSTRFRVSLDEMRSRLGTCPANIADAIRRSALEASLELLVTSQQKEVIRRQLIRQH